MGAYLCDVALNGGWYVNHPYYLCLVANKHRTVFGGLCLLTNGITCPLILTTGLFLCIIPKAVELSVLKGVAGSFCPDFINVTLDGAPLWEF